ncbi:hypothetical protein HZ326_26478 [Fusarium oxysporum f. sp. albedinis]|nr:hypothetical protein HZ326_26478 [Fusarium oxysporum f. sp. albedinis]
MSNLSAVITIASKQARYVERAFILFSSQFYLLSIRNVLALCPALPQVPQCQILDIWNEIGPLVLSLGSLKPKGSKGSKPGSSKTSPDIIFGNSSSSIRLDALFLAHRPFLAVQSSRHQEAGVDERHEQAYRCNYLLLLTISHKFGRVMAFMTIKNQETIGTN